MKIGKSFEGRKLRAGAAVLFLLALVGCGSGGGSGNASAESSPNLTEAKFLEKANAICERGTDRINARYTRAASHVPKDDKNEHFMIEAAARIVIPVRREELRKIRALGLPAGHGEPVEAFLTALQEGIQRGERSHPSLRGADGEEWAFARAYLIGGHNRLGSCLGEE